jgi:hypothetical protein
MEQVTIWYFTDNDHGRKIADSIKTLGLTVNSVEGSDLTEAYLDEDEIKQASFLTLDEARLKIDISMCELLDLIVL